MGITFRKETFRDDFTFRNSPEHIRRFPFPFHEDSYMYAVNIEPHVVGPKGSVLENLIDVDEHYVAEMQDRALVLAEDPLRCQSLPHMTLAGWDLLELLMEQQALGYPEHFTLTRDGDRWRWINRPLGIDDSFTFGDTSTLPYGPMEYITRQSQGDFCILDQRDGNLWMDAGMVTTQADWSLDFDIGMNFFEWHAPVPLAHEKGDLHPGAEVPHQHPAGQAGAAPELDDDHQSAPRHQPGKLSQMGTGPDDGDAGQCRRQGASARRAAELLAAAALQRHRLPDPLLPDQDGRAGHAAEMGAAPAPRDPRPARRTRHLQGPDALSADAGRMAVEAGRRQPDVPGVWAGLSLLIAPPLTALAEKSRRRGGRQVTRQFPFVARHRSAGEGPGRRMRACKRLN